MPRPHLVEIPGAGFLFGSDMNATKTALYSKLTGATALTALLASATSVFDGVAPRGASAPYVIFNIQDDRDENMISERMLDCYLLVKGVSTSSAKEAGLLAAQIDALLHDGTLAVTGWRTFWLRRSQGVDYIETQPDGTYVWHAGGIYRLRMSKQ